MATAPRAPDVLPLDHPVLRPVTDRAFRTVRVVVGSRATPHGLIGRDAADHAWLGTETTHGDWQWSPCDVGYAENVASGEDMWRVFWNGQQHGTSRDEIVLDGPCFLDPVKEMPFGTDEDDYRIVRIEMPDGSVWAVAIRIVAEIMANASGFRGAARVADVAASIARKDHKLADDAQSTIPWAVLRYYAHCIVAASSDKYNRWWRKRDPARCRALVTTCQDPGRGRYALGAAACRTWEDARPAVAVRAWAAERMWTGPLMLDAVSIFESIGGRDVPLRAHIHSDDGEPRLMITVSCSGPAVHDEDHPDMARWWRLVRQGPSVRDVDIAFEAPAEMT